MKEKKSLVIVNDDSEYESFKKIIKYNKSLLEDNILLIDRRENGNFENKSNNNQQTNFEIICFHTSQEWLKFLISANKASKLLLKRFEIDNLYIFFNYDPLAAILIKDLPNITLNLIFQRPEFESDINTKYFSKIIKGSIKALSFYLLTKKICFFKYYDSIHKFVLPSELKTKSIRMYPNKFKNLFKFARIYSNDLSKAKNPVFISSCHYELHSVNYNDFLNDTINFIERHSINYISFHPRENKLFKKSILKRFPKINYFSGFNVNNYSFKPDAVTVSSQVCFNLLLDGYNAFFVPDYFPSTFSAPTINSLREYLLNLNYLY